jgi:hypothetical protein
MRLIWRDWLRKFKKRARKRPFAARLALEMLEDRTLPSGAPNVLAIARLSPAGPGTSASSVSYAVTFDQPVTGVDPSDFKVTSRGSVQAVAPVVVSGSGAIYTVQFNGIHGSGDLHLNLVDDDSIQAGGVPLGGPGTGNGSFQGQAYTRRATKRLPSPTPAVVWMGVSL